MKGSAASAAALALPSRLLLAKDRRPLASKRYASASDDTLTIAFPGTAEEYAATVKLLAGFTKNTGITITPVSYNNNGGWVETFQKPRRLRLKLKPLADARGSETQSADTEPRP